jgi:hypothetical protein
VSDSQWRWVQLPNHPISIRQARQFVQETLDGWRSPVDTADAQVLTGEIASNAVLHTDDGFDLAVSKRGGGVVRVEVHDSDPDPPTQISLDSLALHSVTGRGAAILGALASEWGVEEIADDGKVVWFELRPPRR